MRLLSAHPDLYDARVVFNEFPYGFSTQTPHLGQVAYAEVLFEGAVLNLHDSDPQASSRH
jgi:hypothetical protein